MKGLIFSVKRYAIHDGPGIRVTFFMKGCPLSCWWCHNPEGISDKPEEIDQTDRIGEREFTRKVKAGRFYTVQEVVDILDKERIFIERSGGGVTFSGGEPMLQEDFLSLALRSCRENGYHTAVDTSGHFQPSGLDKVLPYTNLFLFDLKHLDPGKHAEYTGVSNHLIINNLRRILDSNAGLMLRLPVIPGINDDKEHLEALRSFIGEIKRDNIRQISLLPYHRIGLSKYRRFNRPWKMEAVMQPSAGRMNELKDFFSETGLKVKIGG